MERFTHILLPQQALSSLLWRPPFIVTRAGYYEKPVNHSISRSNHPEAILILCIDGKGRVCYKGKEYACSKGWIALIDPSTPHEYSSVPEDPWSILWLHFVGDGIPEYLNLFRKKGLEPIAYRSEYKAISEKMIDILNHLTDFNDTLDIHRACCVFQMLLLDLVAPNSYVSRDQQYIQEAIQFMKSHLYDNIDLSAIAEHLGFTTFHVIRLFHNSLMVTPMQYYFTLQINEAVHLLLNTDMTISEISQKLNFSSPYYFSQAFKKKIGISPAAYRKETQK